jgi:hypothetical protein
MHAGGGAAMNYGSNCGAYTRKCARDSVEQAEEEAAEEGGVGA